ncbi:hypothetical protein ACGFZK_26480 [Streptomyces sp. NPDC048257]|uniref:hypothetical protein n=1 Tax=Streptomyces sp. NPDC048257 TaxID=3365526 RepID=UPI003719757C
MPRRTKWMISLAVLFVAAVELPALVWFCGLLYALEHAGETETRATDCGKAMTAIGWKLPPRTDRQQCSEIHDPLFPSRWEGTFRAPRSEVAGWIETRPAPRYPQQQAGDGPVADPNGLHLNLSYPRSPNFGNGGIDQVTVKAVWEGEDSAVITFETFDD